MTPVTVDSSAVVAGGSGNTVWSARSLHRCHAYHWTHQPSNWIDADSGIGSAEVGTFGSQAIAPSWTTDAEYGIDGFTLFGKNNGFGSSSSNHYGVLCADNSGVPGSVIATSATTLSIAPSAIGNTAGSIDFLFPDPVTLSNGVRYWFEVWRTDAGNSTNYMRWFTRGNVHASEVILQDDGSGGWDAYTTDDPYIGLRLSGSEAQYLVTQDTSIHVWKSTDNGSSWSEQDSGNAPAVVNSSYPFDSSYDGMGWLAVAFFQSANGVRIRLFDTSSDTWIAAGSYSALTGSNVAVAFSNERPIRLYAKSHNMFTVSGSLSSDDADLVAWSYQDGTASGPTTFMSATSAEASMVAWTMIHRGEYYPGYYGYVGLYDVAGDDFEYRVYSSNPTTTVSNIDSDAATSEATHSTINPTPFVHSGVLKYLLPYIDADNGLDVVEFSVGSDATSEVVSAGQVVSASTAYGGRQLASCGYEGSGYIFASIGSGIDIYVRESMSGSWSLASNWKTGLTNCYLSNPEPIDGLGILVAYNDNGDVKVDLYSPPVGKSGSNSLLLNLANAQSSQGSIPGSNSLLLNLSTLADSQSVQAAGSNSLLLSLVNGSLLTRNLSGSNSLLLNLSTLADSQAVQAAGSNSLLLSLVNGSLLTKNFAGSNSLLLNLSTLADSQAVQASGSNSLLLNLANAQSSQGSIPGSNSLLLNLSTLADSQSIQAAGSNSLLLNLSTLADSQSVQAVGSNSLLLSLVNSGSQAVQASGVNSLLLNLANQASSVGSIPGSSALLLWLLNAGVPEEELFPVLDSTSALLMMTQASGSLNAIPGSGSLLVNLANAQSVQGLIPGSNSLLLNLSTLVDSQLVQAVGSNSLLLSMFQGSSAQVDFVGMSEILLIGINEGLVSGIALMGSTEILLLLEMVGGITTAHGVMVGDQGFIGVILGVGLRSEVLTGVVVGGIPVLSGNAGFLGVIDGEGSSGLVIDGEGSSGLVIDGIGDAVVSSEMSVVGSAGWSPESE
jgi:hypothetical protein